VTPSNLLSALGVSRFVFISVPAASHTVKSNSKAALQTFPFLSMQARTAFIQYIRPEGPTRYLSETVVKRTESLPGESLTAVPINIIILLLKCQNHLLHVLEEVKICVI
jgi:hypothetical protein